MLSITYQDRQTNIWVIAKTKVTDVIGQVRRRKWTWAGHVSRIRTNRWIRVTNWKPCERNRFKGRQAGRRRDELDDYWKDTIWQMIAEDRQMWKQHAEASPNYGTLRLHSSDDYDSDIILCFGGHYSLSSSLTYISILWSANLYTQALYYCFGVFTLPENLADWASYSKFR